MCRFTHEVYIASTAVPSRARQLVANHLGEVLDSSAAADDVALIVTELTTNALNAGSEQIVVDLTLHRDHVQIAVSDDAPGEPEVQAPSTSAVHGRGLQIVSVLARRWGTLHLTHGKQVWAEVSVTPSEAWECNLALDQ